MSYVSWLIGLVVIEPASGFKQVQRSTKTCKPKGLAGFFMSGEVQQDTLESVGKERARNNLSK
jgi:hypothetical protein